MILDLFGYPFTYISEIIYKLLMKVTNTYGIYFLIKKYNNAIKEYRIKYSLSS